MMLCVKIKGKRVQEAQSMKDSICGYFEKHFQKCQLLGMKF